MTRLGSTRHGFIVTTSLDHTRRARRPLTGSTASLQRGGSFADTTAVAEAGTTVSMADHMRTAQALRGGSRSRPVRSGGRPLQFVAGEEVRSLAAEAEESTLDVERQQVDALDERESARVLGAPR